MVLSRREFIFALGSLALSAKKALSSYNTKPIDYKDIAVKYEVSPIDAKIENYMSAMSLQEKISQILIYCPKSTSQIIPDSNIILMGWSFPSGLYSKIIEQTKSNKIGSFIAVDQEGGKVHRLRNNKKFRGCRLPSLLSIGKLEDSQVHEEGKNYGSILKEAGINLLLTSIDAPKNRTKMFKEGRAFGTDPETVIKKATSYFNGVKESSPLITILGQHFPNYDINADTDRSISKDYSSKEELKENTKQFFEINTDGFRVSSITYPSISDEPASLDETLVNFARTAGEEKILISDDFRGIVRQYKKRKIPFPLNTATIKMFNTDMDIMMMVPIGYISQAKSLLENYIINSSEAEKKLNRKVKRILSKKCEKGLLNL